MIFMDTVTTSDDGVGQIQNGECKWTTKMFYDRFADWIFAEEIGKTKSNIQKQSPASTVFYFAAVPCDGFFLRDNRREGLF